MTPKLGFSSQLLRLVVTELPKFFLLFGELGRTLPQILPPNLMEDHFLIWKYGSTPLGSDFYPKANNRNGMQEHPPDIVIPPSVRLRALTVRIFKHMHCSQSTQILL